MEHIPLNEQMQSGSVRERELGKNEVSFCEQLSKSKLVAEGANGIIFRVEGSDEVTKLLKIFDQQNFNREYQNQISAVQILDESEIETVSIPRIGDKVTIHIDTDEKLQMLNNNERIRKMKLQVGSEVAVFEMEYFEGKDLARYLLEMVCRTRPDLLDIGDPEALSFEELHMLVGNSLGYEYPNPQRDEGANIAAQAKLRAKNRLKLYQYAHEHCGFHVSPEQLKKLDNSITELHRSGFFHRDLHDRNLLINDRGEFCIIDFGTSIHFTGHVPPKDDIYTVSSEDGVYYDDRNIINMLRKFQDKFNREKMQDAEIAERKEKLMNFISKRLEKIKKTHATAYNHLLEKSNNIENTGDIREILKIATLFCYDINVVGSTKYSEYMVLAISTICIERNIDLRSVLANLDTSNPIELQLHNQLSTII